MECPRTGVLSTARRPFRVVLVDDHEVVRAALRVLLERTGEVIAVAEAGTAAEAVEAVRTSRPDVVLLDLQLPDGSGVDVCHAIRSIAPQTRVLLLTGVPNEATLLKAVQCGAHGYLYKTTSLDQLLRAIQVVASGQSYLGAETTSSVFGLLRARSFQLLGPTASLSAQEFRVMALVVKGKTNKEIAVALGLSDKTVKNYLSHAFEKLRVSNRAEATAVFCRDHPGYSPTSQESPTR